MIWPDTIAVTQDLMAMVASGITAPNMTMKGKRIKLCKGRHRAFYKHTHMDGDTWCGSLFRTKRRRKHRVE